MREAFKNSLLPSLLLSLNQDNVGAKGDHSKYFSIFDWLKSLSYLTNRFHVAVRLFSNRSLMTSKSRKNKEVAHEPQASVSLSFLPHFDVLCDLLLNRPTATWNLFVLYNDQKRKTPIHIPASNRLTF